MELHPCYQNFQFDIHGTDHRQNREALHFKGIRAVFGFERTWENNLRIHRQGRLWWTKAVHLHTIEGTKGIIFGWGTAAYRRRARGEERLLHDRDRADSMYCRMEGMPTSTAFSLFQRRMQPEAMFKISKEAGAPQQILFQRRRLGELFYERRSVRHEFDPFSLE